MCDMKVKFKRSKLKIMVGYFNILCQPLTEQVDRNQQLELNKTIPQDNLNITPCISIVNIIFKYLQIHIARHHILRHKRTTNLATHLFSNHMKST